MSEAALPRGVVENHAPVSVNGPDQVADKDSSDDISAHAALMCGDYHIVATENAEEFLTAIGVGWVKRQLAKVFLKLNTVKTSVKIWRNAETGAENVRIVTLPMAPQQKHEWPPLTTGESVTYKDPSANHAMVHARSYWTEDGSHVVMTTYDEAKLQTRNAITTRTFDSNTRMLRLEMQANGPDVKGHPAKMIRTFKKTSDTPTLKADNSED